MLIYFIIFVVSSSWVIHETPKFLKDFEIVKEIEHGLESRISLVKHRSTTIVYTMRSIHKTKMLQQYRKELFKVTKNFWHTCK